MQPTPVTASRHVHLGQNFYPYNFYRNKITNSQRLAALPSTSPSLRYILTDPTRRAACRALGNTSPESFASGDGTAPDDPVASERSSAESSQPNSAGCSTGSTSTSSTNTSTDTGDLARSRPAPRRRPRLPSSAHFLHTTNDSLPRSSFPYPGGAEALDPDAGARSDATAAAVARARRHANLAGALVQFVSKLPAPSPGSPAAALRAKLGARLAVPALGAWVAQVAEALQDVRWAQPPTPTPPHDQGQGQPQGQPVTVLGERPTGNGAGDTGGEGEHAAGTDVSQLVGTTEGGEGGGGGVASGSAGDGLAEAEALVERMLAAQPQLLAQDSQVLAARLRGLAGLLALDRSAALQLVSERPGLLLLDLPTLERRLAALAAALALPDLAAAAAVARRQPAWLYAELGPPGGELAREGAGPGPAGLGL